jgi:membrane protease YdiL (CAAX protease family)
MLIASGVAYATVFLLTAASVAAWIHILQAWHDRRAEADVARPAVPWGGFDVLLLGPLLWPYLEYALRALTQDEGTETSFTVLTLASITIAHLLWVIVAVLYLEIRTRLRPAELGFDTSHVAGDTWLGVLTFFAALLPVYGIQLLLAQWFEPTEHPLAKLLSEHPSPSLLAWGAVSAVIVAPLSEELLFRVLLQGWLERLTGASTPRVGWRAASARWIPIVISSALFAAMHQGYHRIPLFVLALFLGYLYQRTHRIMPSLVTHGCVNALAIVGLWFALE